MTHSVTHMNGERAPLSSRRARGVATIAAAGVLVAGYLVRPSAPVASTAIEDRPAPILQEVVSRRDAWTMVRRLQEVASRNRRFSARFVAPPPRLERWSDLGEPPALEAERYGLVVDARRLVGRVGDLPEGTPVDVILGNGRQLRGIVAARSRVESLGIVEVDTSEPLPAPPAPGAVAPGDAVVATAPGSDGPLVAPVFVTGVRGGAILLSPAVDRLDGMAVFAADGSLVGVISTSASGTSVLPIEAALRPPEPAAPPRATLGVTLTGGGPHREGAVVVTEVAAGGAAARAGLREGDILLEVDGEAIETLESAASRLSRPGAGEIRLRARRGRRTLERRVDLTPSTPRP